MTGWQIVGLVVLAAAVWLGWELRTAPFEHELFTRVDWDGELRDLIDAQ